MTVEEEPVPKLPRSHGIRLAKAEMFRIALTLLALIGVLVLTRPCSRSVSNFVTGFDRKGSGSAALPKPGNVDMPKEPTQYEQLRPGMTEQEIKDAIERSKARNAQPARTP